MNHSQLWETVQVDHLGQDTENSQNQSLRCNNGTQDSQYEHNPVEPTVCTTWNRLVKDVWKTFWALNDICTLSQVSDNKSEQNSGNTDLSWNFTKVT